MIITLWRAKLLDEIARRLQRLADATDRRAARQWRAYNGAKAREAASTEQRREIERVIAESRTPSARIKAAKRVGAPHLRER